MRRLTIVCLAALLSVAYSCSTKKSTENSEESAETASAEGAYSLVKDAVEVNFTAYKTTKKVPVGGTFKEINVTSAKDGATPLEALDGAAFSVPVSSLFTNDATGTRDPKIVEFFFGVMKNTEGITGTLKVEGETCSIDLTMNGETVNVPLETEMTSENHYTVKGVVDLEKWNALDAVASINKACEALHTGEDGVSKTWSEVAVEAKLEVKKN